MILPHLRKLLYNTRSHFTGTDLINHTTVQTILTNFGGGTGHGTNFRRGDLGLGLIHYSIVSTLRPERVLCIGSEYGFVPAILALACKNQNFGHVDFVDAGYGSNQKNSWGGVSFWKQSTAQKHFSVLGVEKYISCYITTSEKFAKKFPNRKYEYIFIDADHSYQGVKSDYQRFWTRLAARGYISFHDIFLQGLSNGDEFGVWKFWQELKSSHKFTFKTFDNAIGFVQKTK